MDGKQKDARYERWLARAAAAYQRMFDGKGQEELVTLTERENMAVCLGKELAAFLLEEHVAADPAKVPAEASTTCCPKCGQPGKPAAQKAGKRGVNSARAEGENPCGRHRHSARALEVRAVPDRFFFR